MKLELCCVIGRNAIFINSDKSKLRIWLSVEQKDTAFVVVPVDFWGFFFPSPKFLYYLTIHMIWGFCTNWTSEYKRKKFCRNSADFAESGWIVWQKISKAVTTRLLLVVCLRTFTSDSGGSYIECIWMAVHFEDFIDLVEEKFCQ